MCCKQEYTNYCKKDCGKKVPWSDKFEFVNGWYLLIIISDMLCVIGSILKIEIQTKVRENLKHKPVHVKSKQNIVSFVIATNFFFFPLKGAHKL